MNKHNKYVKLNYNINYSIKYRDKSRVKFSENECHVRDSELSSNSSGSRDLTLTRAEYSQSKWFLNLLSTKSITLAPLGITLSCFFRKLSSDKRGIDIITIDLETCSACSAISINTISFLMTLICRGKWWIGV